LLGARAYFTSRPTSSEKGRQMTGNIQAWSVTKPLSQISLLRTSYATNQPSTAKPPMRETTTTWTYRPHG
jgi:hypothetical protein